MRAVYGREEKDVGTDKWWTGGLTIQGMEELEIRARSLRNYKNQIRTNIGRYSLTIKWG